jgi:acyl-CoA reductase-like NAD-dependent aldehyde dehydrogenase
MTRSSSPYRDVDIAAVVAEVVRRLAAEPGSDGPKEAPAGSRETGTGSDGVFPSVAEAVAAAGRAQPKLAALSLEQRGVIVDIIKSYCVDNAEELARLEFQETRLGREDHKIQKLTILSRVVGVEVLRTSVRVGDVGTEFIAAAPFGVIGMVTPATHSIPTMAGNAINIIAAGNTAVFSPHPAAARCLTYALQQMNRRIKAKTGLENLITVMARPSIEAAGELFRHPGVALLTITGGPEVVKVAMQSGKRVIAAAPGNPPVVVDETADIPAAVKDIIFGAAFDNNLLCIGDKEVFVVEAVADEFLAAMRRAGAVELDPRQIERLTQAAFVPDKNSGELHVNREYIGRSTAFLGRAAGITVSAGVDLLFGETDEDHVFVREEQMMPFLPVVRVRDADAAIAAALRAEHGYRHSALIHTRNDETARRMARIMGTTLFIRNAPCTAALGVDGPGYLSYSIATATGEGVTTPLTFTRQRQMVIGGRYDFF